MAQGFRSENSIKACGKIIRIGKDGMGRASITVAIRGRGKRPDLVRFTLTKPLDFDIKVKSNVIVEGHIRSFRYFNQIRDKNVSVQYFVADSIKKDIPALTREYGLPGTHYEQSYFAAFIKGTITYVIETKNPDWYKLRIKTESMETDDVRPSYIEVGYYTKMRLPKFDYEKDENVAIWASVRTPNKEINGQTVYFEDLLVEDIARLDENGEYMEKKKTEEDTNSTIPTEMEIDLPDDDEEEEDNAEDDAERFE